MATSNQAPDIHSQVTSAWQDKTTAERYARAEAATRPYAEIMLDKAHLTPSTTHPINAFDFGCGTGAVTAALYDRLTSSNPKANLRVLGGDISPPMLSYLSARGSKNNWTGLTTEIVDGADIKLDPKTYQFTHIFASAVIFILPLSTLKKLYPLLTPGGYISLLTWSELGWYPLFQRAISSLPASSRPYLPPLEDLRSALQKGSDWHEPEFVTGQLREAGFERVEFVRERVRADAGTPREFCETLRFPLMLVSGHWAEEGRKETLERVVGAVEKVLVGDVGGEEGRCVVEMEGVVAWGWKKE